MTNLNEFKDEIEPITNNKPYFGNNNSTETTAKLRSVFKDGYKAFGKLGPNDNHIRFLPQKKTSKFASYFNFSQWYIEGFGGIVVDDSRYSILNEARRYLKEHPKFKYILWGGQNKEGLKLWGTPRVAFQGFDVQKTPYSLKTYILPGTKSYAQADGQPRPPQAGTIIAEFPLARDLKDRPKYGNIFHCIDGRVVNVIKTGDGMTTKYSPTVDVVWPLDTEEYVHVLEAVLPFDEIINDPKDQDVIDALKFLMDNDRKVGGIELKEAYEYLLTELEISEDEPPTLNQ